MTSMLVDAPRPRLVRGQDRLPADPGIWPTTAFGGAEQAEVDDAHVRLVVPIAGSRCGAVQPVDLLAAAFDAVRALY
ncbi:MAG: hypothetical protein QOJ44_1043 [Acidimicrobiaceae bacterium]|jgi:hypothetical protein|nr:hypothetical protein [Acidimicrobiaceae bacterium]